MCKRKVKCNKYDLSNGHLQQKVYAPRDYRAISPRTRLASQINPLAVQVMNEVDIDIDISSQKPKRIRV